MSNFKQRKEEKRYTLIQVAYEYYTAKAKLYAVGRIETFGKNGGYRHFNSEAVNYTQWQKEHVSAEMIEEVNKAHPKWRNPAGEIEKHDESVKPKITLKELDAMSEIDFTALIKKLQSQINILLQNEKKYGIKY
jgi:hypothetical protein